MSASDMPPRRRGATLAWCGYGLAVVGAVLPPLAVMGPPGLLTEFLAVAALAIALVVLGLAASAPTAFEVGSSRSSARVINFVLLLPASALMVAGFTSPLVFPPIVLLTGAVGSALALLFGLWAPRARPPTKGSLLLVFLALYGAGCGVGAPALIDRRFDHAPGQAFQAKVEARQVTGGRGGPRYGLRLGPWGPRTGPSYAPVTRAQYDATRPGDVACVTLYPGALGMAWYRATPC
jgi:hypothetical protein